MLKRLFFNLWLFLVAMVVTTIALPIMLAGWAAIWVLRFVAGVYFVGAVFFFVLFWIGQNSGMHLHHEMWKCGEMFMMGIGATVVSLIPMVLMDTFAPQRHLSSRSP
jgi:hypothetical protein